MESSLVDIKIKDETVMARDVYDFVYQDQDKKQSFSHWFNRAVRKYEFKEGKDFKSILTQSTGGRPKIDYVVSIDMGKELSMVAPTKQGKIVRNYFLKCEELAKQKIVSRLAGKEIRKSLTESIDESGENERMHGRGYSNYTRLVYELTGLKDKFKFWKVKSKAFRDEYQGNFRDYISKDELERVKQAEALIKPLLEMDKKYSEIKDTLKPIFQPKIGERNSASSPNQKELI